MDAMEPTPRLIMYEYPSPAGPTSAQHKNTVRATIKGQTDRRWEVWGPVAKGSGANVQGQIKIKVDSKLISFYSDKVMSYPKLIVWALEMRRMMDVSVPEGVI
jgi:hypothetical protein